MLVNERKRGLRAIYEVLVVLDRLWDEVPVGNGSGPVGGVLPVECAVQPHTAHQ